MRIGILALQGAVEPHRRKLAALGVEAVPVRTAEELDGVDGLIIPGGESTTLLWFIRQYGLRAALERYAQAHPVWGVCAGSILIARTVENPPQESLGLMPIRVQRNAYGRQNESFIDTLRLSLPEAPEPAEQEGVFIRAPRIVGTDDGVVVLARHGEDPVAVQSGHHMTTTFHPELSAPDAFHRHFLALVEAARERAQSA